MSHEVITGGPTGATSHPKTSRPAARGRSRADADHPVHGHLGRQRRQRCPAEHQECVGVHQRRLPVDGERLRSAQWWSAAARRPAGRSAGPAGDVPDRSGTVHHRVLVSGVASSAAMLVFSRGAQGAGAAPAHARGHVDRHDRLRRPSARHRTGHLGHHRQHGHRRRGAARRHLDHRPGLAGDLLHQRPDRCCRGHPRGPDRGRRAAQRQSAQPRRPRRGHRSGRSAGAGVRRRRHPNRGVGLRSDHGGFRCSRGAARRAHGSRRGWLRRWCPRDLADPVADLGLHRDGSDHRRRRRRHLPQARCSCSRCWAAPPW